MMLFNLVFFQNTYKGLKNFNPDGIYLESGKSDVDFNRPIKNYKTLAYVLKRPEFLSETKSLVAKKKIIKESIGQKLFNTLWSQEVFLSANSKSLNNYNIRLNSLKGNKKHNFQKSLLAKFSKALFNGSIQVSLTGFSNSSTKNLSSLEYLWAKNFKLQALKINDIMQDSVNSKAINSIVNLFDKRLHLDHVPLFTISNHLGQMIISEPPTDLNIVNYQNPHSSTKTHYSNIYHGFFFISYQDAEEYMSYMKQYYKLDNKDLKIFTGNLKMFYKLMSKFDDRVCFRLIPDLRELSQLIKSYRHYRHISFHKNQKYGRNYFQGQPLYFVKQGKKNISYKLWKNSDKEHNLVFFNYDDAIKVCNKINMQIKKVNILAYNLEYFIQDQLQADINDSSSFFIIPSEKSYLFTKKSQLKDKSQLLYSSCLNGISSISLWSKRILWSLTSRKPIIHF
jgi:hypothetical protein